jgi:predicted lipase
MTQLGGALALVAASTAKNSWNLPKPIEVISYGSPRVGNTAFAQWVNANIRVWRFTHAQDPVPLVPLPVRFTHAGTEVWENKGRFKVCAANGMFWKNNDIVFTLLESMS